MEAGSTATAAGDGGLRSIYDGVGKLGCNYRCARGAQLFGRNY